MDLESTVLNRRIQIRQALRWRRSHCVMEADAAETSWKLCHASASEFMNKPDSSGKCKDERFPFHRNRRVLAAVKSLEEAFQARGLELDLELDCAKSICTLYMNGRSLDACGLPLPSSPNSKRNILSTQLCSPPTRQKIKQTGKRESSAACFSADVLVASMHIAAQLLEHLSCFDDESFHEVLNIIESFVSEYGPLSVNEIRFSKETIETIDLAIALLLRLCASSGESQNIMMPSSTFSNNSDADPYIFENNKLKKFTAVLALRLSLARGLSSGILGATAYYLEGDATDALIDPESEYLLTASLQFLQAHSTSVNLLQPPDLSLIDQSKDLVLPKNIPDIEGLCITTSSCGRFLFLYFPKSGTLKILSTGAGAVPACGLGMELWARRHCNDLVGSTQFPSPFPSGVSNCSLACVGEYLILAGEKRKGDLKSRHQPVEIFVWFAKFHDPYKGCFSTRWAPKFHSTECISFKKITEDIFPGELNWLNNKRSRIENILACSPVELERILITQGKKSTHLIMICLFSLHEACPCPHGCKSCSWREKSKSVLVEKRNSMVTLHESKIESLQKESKERDSSKGIQMNRTTFCIGHVLSVETETESKTSSGLSNVINGMEYLKSLEFWTPPENNLDQNMKENSERLAFMSRISHSREWQKSLSIFVTNNEILLGFRTEAFASCHARIRCSNTVRTYACFNLDNGELQRWIEGSTFHAKTLAITLDRSSGSYIIVSNLDHEYHVMQSNKVNHSHSLSIQAYVIPGMSLITHTDPMPLAKDSSATMASGQLTPRIVASIVIRNINCLELSFTRSNIKNSLKFFDQILQRSMFLKDMKILVSVLDAIYVYINRILEGGGHLMSGILDTDNQFCEESNQFWFFAKTSNKNSIEEILYNENYSSTVHLKACNLLIDCVILFRPPINTVYRLLKNALIASYNIFGVDRNVDGLMELYLSRLILELVVGKHGPYPLEEWILLTGFHQSCRELCKFSLKIRSTLFQNGECNCEETENHRIFTDVTIPGFLMTLFEFSWATSPPFSIQVLSLCFDEASCEVIDWKETDFDDGNLLSTTPFCKLLYPMVAMMEIRIEQSYNHSLSTLTHMNDLLKAISEFLRSASATLKKIRSKTTKTLWHSTESTMRLSCHLFGKLVGQVLNDIYPSTYSDCFNTKYFSFWDMLVNCQTYLEWKEISSRIIQNGTGISLKDDKHKGANSDYVSFLRVLAGLVPSSSWRDSETVRIILEAVKRSTSEHWRLLSRRTAYVTVLRVMLSAFLKHTVFTQELHDLLRADDKCLNKLSQLARFSKKAWNRIARKFTQMLGNQSFDKMELGRKTSLCEKVLIDDSFEKALFFFSLESKNSYVNGAYSILKFTPEMNTFLEDMLLFVFQPESSIKEVFEQKCRATRNHAILCVTYGCLLRTIDCFAGSEGYISLLEIIFSAWQSSKYSFLCNPLIRIHGTHAQQRMDLVHFVEKLMIMFTKLGQHTMSLSSFENQSKLPAFLVQICGALAHFDFSSINLKNTIQEEIADLTVDMLKASQKVENSFKEVKYGREEVNDLQETYMLAWYRWQKNRWDPEESQGAPLDATGLVAGPCMRTEKDCVILQGDLSSSFSPQEIDDLGEDAIQYPLLDSVMFCSAYFEITVIEPGAGGVIVVGAIKSMSGKWQGGHLGHHLGSFGYHLDDGTFQANDHVELSGICPGITKGDVVGIGWSSLPNLAPRSYFVTKNGMFLAKIDLTGKSSERKFLNENDVAQLWYPAVTARVGAKFDTNFGKTSFRYAPLENARLQGLLCKRNANLVSINESLKTSCILSSVRSLGTILLSLSHKFVKSHCHKILNIARKNLGNTETKPETLAENKLQQQGVYIDSHALLGPPIAVCRLPLMHSKNCFSFNVTVCNIEDSVFAQPTDTSQFSIFTFLLPGQTSRLGQPSRLVCFFQKKMSSLQGKIWNFQECRICLQDLNSNKIVAELDLEKCCDLQLCVSYDGEKWHLSVNNHVPLTFQIEESYDALHGHEYASRALLYIGCVPDLEMSKAPQECLTGRYKNLVYSVGKPESNGGIKPTATYPLLFSNHICRLQTTFWPKSISLWALNGLLMVYNAASEQYHDSAYTSTRVLGTLLEVWADPSILFVPSKAQAKLIKLLAILLAGTSPSDIPQIVPTLVKRFMFPIPERFMNEYFCPSSKQIARFRQYMSMLFRIIFVHNKKHSMAWKTSIDRYFYNFAHELKSSADTQNNSKVVIQEKQASEKIRRNTLQHTMLFITAVLKICAPFANSLNIGTAGAIFEGAPIQILDWNKKLDYSALFFDDNTELSVTAANLSRGKSWERVRKQFYFLLKKRQNSEFPTNPFATARNFLSCDSNCQSTVFGWIPAELVRFRTLPLCTNYLSFPTLPKAFKTLHNILQFLKYKFQGDSSKGIDCTARLLITWIIETVGCMKSTKEDFSNLHADVVILSMKLFKDSAMKEFTKDYFTCPETYIDSIQWFAQEISEFPLCLGFIPNIQSFTNYDYTEIGLTGATAKVARFLRQTDVLTYFTSRSSNESGTQDEQKTESPIRYRHVSKRSNLPSIHRLKSRNLTYKMKIYKALGRKDLPRHREGRLRIGSLSFDQRLASFNKLGPGIKLSISFPVSDRISAQKHNVASLVINQDGDLILHHWRRNYSKMSYSLDQFFDMKQCNFSRIASHVTESQKIIQSTYPFQFGYSRKYRPVEGKLAASLIINGDPIPHNGCVTEVRLALGKKPMQSPWVLGLFKRIDYHRCLSSVGDAKILDINNEPDWQILSNNQFRFRLINACEIHVETGILHDEQRIKVSPPLKIVKGFYLGISAKVGQLFLLNKIEESAGHFPSPSENCIQQIRLNGALNRNNGEVGSPLYSNFFFSSDLRANVTEGGEETKTTLYSGLATNVPSHKACLVVPFSVTVEQPDILLKLPDTRYKRSLLDSGSSTQELTDQASVHPHAICRATVLKIPEWWFRNPTSNKANVDIVTDYSSSLIYFLLNGKQLGPGLDFHDIIQRHQMKNLDSAREEKRIATLFNIDVRQNDEILQNLESVQSEKYHNLEIPSTIFDKFNPGSCFLGSFKPSLPNSDISPVRVFLRVNEWIHLKSDTCLLSWLRGMEGRIVFKALIYFRDCACHNGPIEIVGIEINPETIAFGPMRKNRYLGAYQVLSIPLDAPAKGKPSSRQLCGNATIGGATGKLILQKKCLTSLSFGSYLHIESQNATKLPLPAAMSETETCPFTIEMWIYLERSIIEHVAESEHHSSSVKFIYGRKNVLASYGTTEEGLSFNIDNSPDFSQPRLSFEIHRHSKIKFQHSVPLHPKLDYNRWMHVALAYQPPGWEWKSKCVCSALKISPENSTSIVKVRPGNKEQSSFFGSVALKLLSSQDSTADSHIANLGAYMWDMHALFSGSIHVSLQYDFSQFIENSEFTNNICFGGNINVKCGDIVEFTLDPSNRSASICVHEPSGKCTVRYSTDDISVNLNHESELCLIPHVTLNNIGDEVFFVTDPRHISRCSKTPHPCVLGVSKLFKDGKPATQTDEQLISYTKSGNGTNISLHSSTEEMLHHYGWCFGQILKPFLNPTSLSASSDDCDTHSNKLFEQCHQEVALKNKESTAGKAWGMQILDIRMWSTCLSNESIASRFNITLNGSEPCLVGWWPLLEGHGNIGYDCAAFGRGFFADGIIHKTHSSDGSSWVILNENDNPLDESFAWSGAVSEAEQPPLFRPFKMKNVASTGPPLSIEDDDRSTTICARMDKSDSWSMAIGNQPLRSGLIHKWHVHVEDIGSNGTVCLGVISVEGENAGFEFTYPGSTNNSWGYCGRNGMKFNSAKSTAYGPSFESGDTVLVTLDLIHDTLAFEKNGTSIGIAFQNCFLNGVGNGGTLVAAISLCGIGYSAIRLSFGQHQSVSHCLGIANGASPNYMETEATLLSAAADAKNMLRDGEIEHDLKKVMSIAYDFSISSNAPPNTPNSNDIQRAYFTHRNSEFDNVISRWLSYDKAGDSCFPESVANIAFHNIQSKLIRATENTILNWILSPTSAMSMQQLVRSLNGYVKDGYESFDDLTLVYIMLLMWKRFRLIRNSPHFITKLQYILNDTSRTTDRISRQDPKQYLQKFLTEVYFDIIQLTRNRLNKTLAETSVWYDFFTSHTSLFLPMCDDVDLLKISKAARRLAFFSTLPRSMKAKSVSIFNSSVSILIDVVNHISGGRDAMNIEMVKRIISGLRATAHSGYSRLLESGIHCSQHYFLLDFVISVCCIHTNTRKDVDFAFELYKQIYCHRYLPRALSTEFCENFKAVLSSAEFYHKLCLPQTQYSSEEYVNFQGKAQDSFLIAIEHTSTFSQHFIEVLDFHTDNLHRSHYSLRAKKYIIDIPADWEQFILRLVLPSKNGDCGTSMSDGSGSKLDRNPNFRRTLRDSDIAYLTVNYKGKVVYCMPHDSEDRENLHSIWFPRRVFNDSDQLEINFPVYQPLIWRIHNFSNLKVPQLVKVYEHNPFVITCLGWSESTRGDVPMPVFHRLNKAYWKGCIIRTEHPLNTFLCHDNIQNSFPRNDFSFSIEIIRKEDFISIGLWCSSSSKLDQENYEKFESISDEAESSYNNKLGMSKNTYGFCFPRTVAKEKTLPLTFSYNGISYLIGESFPLISGDIVTFNISFFPDQFMEVQVNNYLAGRVDASICPDIKWREIQEKIIWPSVGLHQKGDILRMICPATSRSLPQKIKRVNEEAFSQMDSRSGLSLEIIPTVTKNEKSVFRHLNLQTFSIDCKPVLAPPSHHEKAILDIANAVLNEMYKTKCYCQNALLDYQDIGKMFFCSNNSQTMSNSGFLSNAMLSQDSHLSYTGTKVHHDALRSGVLKHIAHMLASLRVNESYRRQLAQYANEHTFDVNQFHKWSTFLLDLNQAAFEALRYIVKYGGLNGKEINRGFLSSMMKALAPRFYAMPKRLLLQVELMYSSTPIAQGVHQQLNIQIERQSALSRKRSENIESGGQRRSIFAQLQEVLNDVDVVQLRTALGAYPFIVSLVGEDSIDQAVVYREVFSSVVDELKNGIALDLCTGSQLRCKCHEQLFALCSNGRNSLGTNRECFLPSADANNFHLKQTIFHSYVTVGRLMGIAIRSNTPMSLCLAPMVYKGIIGTTISWTDVCDVDSYIADFVSRLTLRVPDWKSLFENGIPVWSVLDSWGRNVQIGKNGKTDDIRLLADDDVPEYIDSVKEFRMKEFSEAIEAIRLGLCEIVPSSCLTFSTWRDLANHVECGGL